MLPRTNVAMAAIKAISEYDIVLYCKLFAGVK